MRGHDPGLSIAENYRRFAREVGARSPPYAVLAEAVAADETLLAFLAALPSAKRQPNLLFAAARFWLDVPADIGTLRDLVREHPNALAAVIRARRTQMNEAGRCATLLPALAGLAGPLALLEVGASAGLTLLPDCYSYDYAGHRLQAPDTRAPTLACQPHSAVPLPERLPLVEWRAGLDLDPLDASNLDDARWLECLIWPGEADRHSRLHAALDVARRHRPRVYRGDLVDDLARIAANAPRHATLVVYHSAVLAYVDETTRQAFATAVRELDAVWLSNEAPGIVSGPTDAARESASNTFALIRDGCDLLAFTDSHGAWIDWLR